MASKIANAFPIGISTPAEAVWQQTPAQQATDLLRKAVLDVDSNLTLFNIGSLEDQLALPLFPARAAAIVLGVFGVLAMVLAATGLFALVAYGVAR